MTLLNSNPGYPGTSLVWKHARSICRWFFDLLINKGVAAFLIHRERQSNLVILSRFSDRELRDMGLHRGQIVPALEGCRKVPRVETKPEPLEADIV